MTAQQAAYLWLEWLEWHGQKAGCGDWFTVSVPDFVAWRIRQRVPLFGGLHLLCCHGHGYVLIVHTAEHALRNLLCHDRNEARRRYRRYWRSPAGWVSHIRIHREGISVVKASLALIGEGAR